MNHDDPNDHLSSLLEKLEKDIRAGLASQNRSCWFPILQCRFPNPLSRLQTMLLTHAPVNSGSALCFVLCKSVSQMSAPKLHPSLACYHLILKGTTTGFTLKQFCSCNVQKQSTAEHDWHRRVKKDIKGHQELSRLCNFRFLFLVQSKTKQPHICVDLFTEKGELLTFSWKPSFAISVSM